ncbi:hypothetical protein JK229_18950 [Pantoea dispersa]|uniref:hypothetical protein n=1 Tax=Pantoea dispersa TaxID=59814 RepID=UPI001BA883B7|nr:hypothetical protein [Pantoea dispersa]MBS0907199.1 hypothetical protein [Pantoea dispersa]WEA06422.1 hypothetical protein PWF83_03110 [Pantoea dispersa]
MLKLILTLLLVGFSVAANAALLKDKYRDKNNDLICVYDSHGHIIAVNVGFNGHCSFSVSDDEI